jgi:DNA-binding transcriptional MerR regulator
MAEKLDIGKALDKLRSRDEPKSRMTVLDEKNKALDEELQRLRAERRRLERDNPGPPKRD